MSPCRAFDAAGCERTASRATSVLVRQLESIQLSSIVVLVKISECSLQLSVLSQDDASSRSISEGLVCTHARALHLRPLCTCDPLYKSFIAGLQRPCKEASIFQGKVMLLCQSSAFVRSCTCCCFTGAGCNGLKP